jgi:hypothetical protein
MHRAQSAADNFLDRLELGAVASRALKAREAVKLAESLQDDARDAAYSGALSIAEAIQGLDTCLFTWATVKLYYSVFYLARAALALRRVAIIYSRTTPYAWVAEAGETPTKRRGTTHKVVLGAFAQYLKGSVLVSQQIGADEPFEWLVARREAAC